MNFKQNIAILLFATSCSSAYAQKEQQIVINTQKPVAAIQPTMWGVFFEDINMGADGGIYAELVKNRSFEFAKPLMGWSIKGKKITEGDVLVLNRQEKQLANPRFLRLNIKEAQKGEAGITNEGFKGMGIKKDLKYDFSLMYRLQRGNVTLHVELIDSKNTVIGTASLKPSTGDANWHKQSISLIANATVEKAKLNVWLEGDGLIDMDMISLFPTDTWKGRPGGMRADMIQMLADMKPGFIRFPGGCIVEGMDLANRYQWKKTIGPIEDRQLIMNRWNVEFAHRPAPDYFQTFGLGFFEYFQLAEDIGAAALPILNCGMACQYNTAELVPIEQLGPYIQDALDLIEFANGDINSEWGKIRASMGHPKPFNLKYLGVGNENWGPQYIERAKLFQQKIKEKYPDIKLIYSSGTDPDSERFNYLNKELRNMNADIIDEHYYRSPEWFLKNASRYDSYDRKGAKVFAGEFAAHIDNKITGSNKNTWEAAIAEAAFMTGLERNAEVVNMASYAPLFANAEGWQWAPDLIWVNNLNVYGTPNYYVQKQFSVNKGTHVLNATLNSKPISNADGLYASSVIDTIKKEIIVKLINTASTALSKTIVFEGNKKINAKATITVMKGNLNEKSSFEQPQIFAPKEEEFMVKRKNAALNLAPNSFTLVKVSYQ
jgi:alpha-N-arabinofuranosidase